MKLDSTGLGSEVFFVRPKGPIEELYWILSGCKRGIMQSVFTMKYFVCAPSGTNASLH